MQAFAYETQKKQQARATKNKTQDSRLATQHDT